MIAGEGRDAGLEVPVHEAQVRGGRVFERAERDVHVARVVEGPRGRQLLERVVQVVQGLGVRGGADDQAGLVVQAGRECSLLRGLRAEVPGEDVIHLLAELVVFDASGVGHASLHHQSVKCG